MADCFYLDGEPIPFQPGQSVLDAVLAEGRTRHCRIPYFCFHPALGSLGACRQCGVKVYPHDGKHPPRIFMACLLPASANLQVVSAETDVQKEHQCISEFLMANHPHDCPICDEGGQCHLQDMTVASGHALRQRQGPKRQYRNQMLGPLIQQNMNRCITCYRCVRFYRDVAGGEDFGVFGSRNRVFFGRLADGALESPFAGNLAEVCPTGVFTDKVYHQQYLRPWDLDTQASICPHCSLGCNTETGAARGILRRVRQRPHAEINPWFLCDRGRYGFRHVDAPQRPRQARVAGQERPMNRVLDRLAARLSEGRSAFLGSPREDLDSNLALLALADICQGPYAAFPRAEEEALAAAQLAQTPAPSLLTLSQGNGDILLLGEGERVTPSLSLALRKAVTHGAKIHVYSTLPSAIDDLATTYCRLPPSQLQTAGSDWQPRRGRPGYILVDSESIGAERVHTLGQGLKQWPTGSGILVLSRYANLAGAAFFAAQGHTARWRQALESGDCNHLLLLARDPLGRDDDGPWWRAHPDIQISVMDHLATASSAAAEHLLPTAAWAERAGLSCNGEARLQAFAQAYTPAQERRRWRSELGPFPLAAGGALETTALPTPTELCAALAERLGQGAAWEQRRHFYRDFLCPQEPAIDGLGQHLPETLLARFRLATPMGPEASASGPQQPPPWQVGCWSWYGDEALANAAPELQKLAPSRALRLAPGQTQARQARVIAGDGVELALPLLELPGMARGVLALDAADLAFLGLRPGASVQVHWGPE